MSNDWVKWFAWYPVSDGDTIAWLRVVERKLVPVFFNNGDIGEEWVYLL